MHATSCCLQLSYRVREFSLRGLALVQHVGAKCLVFGQTAAFVSTLDQVNGAIYGLKLF